MTFRGIQCTILRLINLRDAFQMAQYLLIGIVDESATIPTNGILIPPLGAFFCVLYSVSPIVQVDDPRMYCCGSILHMLKG